MINDQDQNYQQLRFEIIPSLIDQLQIKLNDKLSDIDHHPSIHRLAKYVELLTHIISKFTVKKLQCVQDEDSSNNSLFCSSTMPQFNERFINIVANNQLPPAFKNNHIFSACLLEKGTKVGLCLGAQEPFLIYDLNTQEVQTVQIEKSGVFDAVEITGQGIVLGCNKTIKLVHDHVITNFPDGLCTPSRLLIQDDDIFATDCLTQLGQGGSYCTQWSFKHKNVVNYKMESKSSGAITLDQNQLIAADLNKRIYIWTFGNPTPIKILKSEEIITSLITSALRVITGAGRTKFYVWNWQKKSNHICQLDYEKKLLNALTLMEVENNYLVGDNQGYVTLIDQKKKTQVELLKMRSKIMKLQQLGKRFIGCSYEGSFCVFDLNIQYQQ